MESLEDSLMDFIYGTLAIFNSTASALGLTSNLVDEDKVEQLMDEDRRAAMKRYDEQAAQTFSADGETSGFGTSINVEISSTPETCVQENNIGTNLAKQLSYKGISRMKGVGFSLLANESEELLGKIFCSLKEKEAQLQKYIDDIKQESKEKSQQLNLQKEQIEALVVRQTELEKQQAESTQLLYIQLKTKDLTIAELFSKYEAKEKEVEDLNQKLKHSKSGLTGIIQELAEINDPSHQGSICKAHNSNKELIASLEASHKECTEIYNSAEFAAKKINKVPFLQTLALENIVPLRECIKTVFTDVVCKEIGGQ